MGVAVAAPGLRGALMGGLSAKRTGRQAEGGLRSLGLPVAGKPGAAGNPDRPLLRKAGMSALVIVRIPGFY
jgi:hypothetical protein